MIKQEARRLQPNAITEDTSCADAIIGLEDYDPKQAKYAKTKLGEAKKAVADARTDEAKADATAALARQAAMRAEWSFHNLVLGAKGQVKAQYGEDSDEMKTIGLNNKT
jgi:predicted ABC-class ATPase